MAQSASQSTDLAADRQAAVLPYAYTGAQAEEVDALPNRSGSEQFAEVIHELKQFIASY